LPCLWNAAAAASYFLGQWIRPALQGLALKRLLWPVFSSPVSVAAALTLAIGVQHCEAVELP
jgi:hypothetical protein